MSVPEIRIHDSVFNPPARLWKTGPKCVENNCDCKQRENVWIGREHKIPPLHEGCDCVLITPREFLDELGKCVWRISCSYLDVGCRAHIWLDTEEPMAVCKVDCKLCPSAHWDGRL